MPIPSVKSLINMLECLDWSGHVELPRTDLEWLATQIRRFLVGTPGKCGICGNIHSTTIATSLGSICCDCIEDLHEDVA
jgi:hypothetical protein